MHGLQFQSLVRELKSHMPQGTAKKKKKKDKSVAGEALPLTMIAHYPKTVDLNVRCDCFANCFF